MAAVTGYDRTKRCCYRSCDDPARWVIRLWHYRRGVRRASVLRRVCSRGRGTR